MYIWFEDLDKFKNILKLIFPNDKFKAFKIEDALMIKPLIYKEEKIFLVLKGEENIKSFLLQSPLLGVSSTNSSHVKVNFYVTSLDLFLRTLGFEKGQVDRIFVPESGHLIVTFFKEKSILVFKYFSDFPKDQRQIALNACKPFNVVECNRISEELISQ